MKVFVAFALIGVALATEVQQGTHEQYRHLRDPHTRPKKTKENDVDYSRENIIDVDYFDCSKKPNGMYQHPNDCTRYIMCIYGTAIDMACCDCDNAHFPEKCDGSGYYRFDANSTFCEIPADVPCEVGGPCHGMRDGDPCDKDDCEHCGYCVDTVSYFFRCERQTPDNPKENITGIIRKSDCGPDLWWNPDLKPENATMGGACDIWDNLSETVRENYKKDPICNPPVLLCAWGQDPQDVCTGKHWYFDPKTMAKGEREDRHCNGDLVWDKKSETCRECRNVAGCTC